MSEKQDSPASKNPLTGNDLPLTGMGIPEYPGKPIIRDGRIIDTCPADDSEST
jgi:hypothetical protein